MQKHSFADVPQNSCKRLQLRCFSCEICQIFKNNCFEKHLKSTASAVGNVKKEVRFDDYESEIKLLCNH